MNIIRLLLTTIVACLPFACSIDVCGKETFTKCDSLLDTDCIAKFLRALKLWYQGPVAKGFFIKPVEPVVVKQFKFGDDYKLVTLNDAQVSGLTKDNTQIPSMIRYDDYYSAVNIFNYNLVITASYSTITELSDNRKIIQKAPVTIEIDNLNVVEDIFIQVFPRCDNRGYFNITPTIRTIAGSFRITKGLAGFSCGLDCETSLLEAAAQLSSDVTFDRLNQFAHYISHDQIVWCY